VLRVPGPFNYADLNNRAVSTARGEILALLNNDVEATHEGWLHTMAAQAMRPDIGAVGAKLLFEDGTIQHAGIIMGIGGIAGHAHKYMAAAENGYQSRLQLSHNVCAVTGAALVLRKSVFEQVSGFDSENLAVNYNDVDLCLRIMAAGYRNIFCADAVLIHHESKSRGAPVEPKAYRQWQAEREIMLSRWPHAIAADPHYSPHLSLLEEDLSISLKPASWQARRAILSDRQL
jgi:GT2 family glycosyltransferase